MAARVVTIDIVAVLRDRASGQARKINSALDKMKRMKTKISLALDDSKFLKKINQVKQNLRQLMQSKASVVLKATDKASQTLSKVTSKLKAFAKGSYKIALEMKDAVTSVIARVQSRLRTITSKVYSVAIKVKDSASSVINKIVSLLKSPILSTGIMLGAGFGVASSINTYKDFEAGMSKVKAVSGATSKEMEALTAKAKEMGATTKFTATESAEALNYMAMAGWKTDQMLSGIGGIMNLAAASGEDLGTTSDIVTDALTAFGMQAKDATHFSDVLAAATSNANTNVSLMGETFKYVGTMSGSMKYSIEDVALATGLMANAGLKGSMAGTALNTVMTRLSTNTRGAQDAIKKIGVEFFNADGSARDLSDVMGELRKVTAGMTAEQKSNLAKTVAGVEAQKGLLAILNASETDYLKLATAINNADGAAGDMAETMLDNLQGSLTLLSSAADGTKMAFGERLAPYLRSFADWLTGQMPAITESLNKFMDSVDEKVDILKAKFAAISQSADWKNADFFGKVKIAWDELIAEPFSEWWNGKGRSALVSKTADIGKVIAEGIVKGFGSLATSHPLLALLVGGKIAGNAMSSIGGLVRGFKSLFSRSGTGTVVGASGAMARLAGAVNSYGMATINVATANINVGTTAGMGNFASRGTRAANAVSSGGVLLTDGARRQLAATTTTAPAAVPLTASSKLFGKLTGLAASSAGTYTFNKGWFAGKTVGASAASGLGMGAAAGGVVGGVAILSGIKDAVGAIKSGNEYNKKYKQGSATAKIGGTALGAAVGTMILPGVGTLIGAGIGGLGGMLLSDKAGKASAKDAKKTSEALAELKQEQEELASSSLAKHFGEVSLSASEVTKSVNKLIGAANTEQFEKMGIVLGNVKESFEQVNSAATSLDKNMWYATLKKNTKLTESEMQNLSDSAKLYTASVQNYIGDSQYAAAKSTEHLVTNADAAQRIIDKVNEYYNNLGSQIDVLSEKYNNKLNEAMSDGMITAEEQAGLNQLKAGIEAVSQKTQGSDIDTNTAIFKAKMAGDIDFESFSSVMSEFHDKTSGFKDQIYEEYGTIAVALEEGSKEWLDATGAMYGSIGAINIPAIELGTDKIKEKYKSELGVFGKDLKSVYNEYLKNPYDFSKNVAKISKEDRAGIAEMVDAMAPMAKELEQVKNGYDEVFKGYAKIGEDVPADIKQNYDNIVAQLEQFNFLEAVSGGSATTREFMKEYDATIKLNMRVEYANSVVDAIKKDNLKELSNPINMAVTLGLSAVKTFSDESNITADDFGVPNSVSKNVLVDIFGKAVIKNKVSLTPASFGIPSVINTAVRIGLTATTGLKNNHAFRGGIFEPERYAAGGKVAGGARLVTVAEEGTPEMIIPLGAHRRSRGIELWKQAGDYLGVKGYAQGGFVGGTPAMIDNHDGQTQIVSTGNPIEINVGGITIQINAKEGQSADETIGENVESIANQVAKEIAMRLGTQFANTPLKAG